MGVNQQRKKVQRVRTVGMNCGEHVPTRNTSRGAKIAFTRHVAVDDKYRSCWDVCRANPPHGVNVVLVLFVLTRFRRDDVVVVDLGAFCNNEVSCVCAVVVPTVVVWVFVLL